MKSKNFENWLCKFWKWNKKKHKLIAHSNFDIYSYSDFSWKKLREFLNIVCWGMNKNHYNEKTCGKALDLLSIDATVSATLEQSWGKNITTTDLIRNKISIDTTLIKLLKFFHKHPRKKNEVVLAWRTALFRREFIVFSKDPFIKSTMMTFWARQKAVF